LKQRWCIGELTADFLWQMEDVLNLYEQPYDPLNPQVTFDERPCQLIDNVLQPLPMEAGKPKREDYHYQRNGVCNVFIAFQPHTGQRLVSVYQRRTAKEYADFFKQLSEHFADALSITVVQDNLNTHTPASFYKFFKPAEAFAMAQKFSMHYRKPIGVGVLTPKNASWLNMAEIELAALSKQCLDRRIPDMETLEREAKAWTEERNLKGITVKWQFTTKKAREKFSRFYPNIS